MKLYWLRGINNGTKSFIEIGPGKILSVLIKSIDKNLEIVNADVRNINVIKDHIIKSDLIIPLAAIVGAPACDKDPINSKINVDFFSDFSQLRYVKISSYNEVSE